MNHLTAFSVFVGSFLFNFLFNVLFIYSVLKFTMCVNNYTRVCNNVHFCLCFIFY